MPLIMAPPMSRGPPRKFSPHINKRRHDATRSSTSAAFCVLLIAHLAAALYAPIQDCDEVFNFWEPTHYLNHGYGLQTWEMSPVYAIRSWLYISLHALPIKLFSLISFHTASSKTKEFYALRVLFAITAASCETHLYTKIARCMNKRIAVIYALITATSAGSFIASTSYLPSSFAMYTVSLAMAAFLDHRDGWGTAQGLIWLAIGSVIGWPFVALLSLPFLFEEVILGLIGGGVRTLRLLRYTCLSAGTILSVEILVDSLFIRKATSVPFNIVLYNMFAGPGRGPDIYGTEPWHFYLQNLLLNFNVWFLLAMLCTPLLMLHCQMPRRYPTRLDPYRSYIIVAPFYLWLSVMSLQPHKEERFMYPVYPCLAINAAVSTHITILMLSNTNSHTVIGRFPARLKLFGLAGAAFTFAALGIWRSVGLSTAYGAPMRVYEYLHDPLITGIVTKSKSSDINVCVGKEWYRFPSSYHLPSPPSSDRTYRLRFISSAFHGLLPGTFTEASPDSWLDALPGTWVEPATMNDENKEDLTKYTNIAGCDFLVDSSFDAAEPTNEEPDYVSVAKQGQSDWKVLACERFLDSSRSGLLGRLGWIPNRLSDMRATPSLLKRRWGNYCLLGRKA